jgi:SAM-dependent methyltransferase
MDADREKWNRKYREGAGPTRPSAAVERFWSLAPPGRALDLAAGNGRNALFLAEKGFTVDAVDISDVAVDELKGRHPDLFPIQADLDSWEIPENQYSIILNIRFLSRRLFPYIREALIPGGVFIAETFLESPGEEDHFSRRDFLLRENELLHAFLPLRIRHYAERESRDAPHGPCREAVLVAVKPA